MKKLVFVITCLLLISCTKENEDLELPESIPSKRLHRVYSNGTLERKYEYDEDNRVIELLFYGDGDINSKDVYEYNGDTIYFIQDNYSFNLHQDLKFYPINDTLIRIDIIISGSPILNAYRYFDNNSCGRVYSEIFTTDGSLSIYAEFEYTDENCSLILSNYYPNGNLKNREELQKENKPSPYTSTYILDVLKISELNNTIKRDYYNSNNHLVEEWSYESTFEYNSIGYPIKENRDYVSGPSKTLTYEYFSE